MMGCLCWLLVVGLAYMVQGCDDKYDGVMDVGRVIERPTKMVQVETYGTSTRNVDEVQEIGLWSHQVIDVQIKGKLVSGGSWRLDFCDFDVLLPGQVSFAPLPGEGSDKSLIVVITPTFNITETWVNFGVYAGYPIRISTSNSVAKQDLEVYRIFFSKCTPEICDGVTVKLDREYTGPLIEGIPGTAWGCSWNTPDVRLSYNADANSVKNAFEAILGPKSIQRVVKSSIASNGEQGYNYRVFLSKGVNGVHVRVDGSELRGEALSSKAEQVARGASIGDVYQHQKQGWGGNFKLKFKGETTEAIAPNSDAVTVANKLRALTALGPDLTVTKSQDGWSWQVTFKNEVGDVPILEPVDVALTPVGGNVSIATIVSGEATLEGEFQLVGNGKSVRIPATATDVYMRSALRDQLGFKDVSVRRVGPTTANGYTWFIEFAENCPTQFDTSKSGLQFMDKCVIDLASGPETSNLLLGNNATLTLRNKLIVELGLVNGQQVSWTENSAFRLPKSLPDPRYNNLPVSTVELPLGSTERGRYLFEARLNGQLVKKQTVFIDARPPYAAGGEELSVSFPTDWMDLNATGSKGWFGSTIESYQWSLLSKPVGSGATSGEIINPDQIITVARYLNKPGVFTYGLKVTDNLGLVGCMNKKVQVLFAPQILQPLNDVSAIPGEDVELFCNASGSLPLTYSWYFKTFQLDANAPLLSLTSVTEEDQGNYSCAVTNPVGTVKSNMINVNIMNGVTIVNHPESLFASPLNVANLSCTARGSYPLSVHWERRDFASTSSWTLVNGGNQTVNSGNEETGTRFVYSIKNPSEEDEGEYRCVVANRVGPSISKPAFLDVMDLPTNVTLAVIPQSVLTNGIDEGEGANFALKCTAVGVNLEYGWTREGNVLDQHAGKDTVVFNNITREQHAGNYRCSATNGAGTIFSEPAFIDVNTAPYIIVQPKSVVADPGEKVLISVLAGGAKPLQYLWKKNGQYINEHYATTPNITFEEVQESNSGNYSVVIHNRLGYVSSIEVELTVRDPPMVYEPETTVELERDPGQQVVFRCEANGTGTLSFYWEKRPIGDTNGTWTRVIHGRERSGENWAELEIRNIEYSDEQDYVCVASSRLGEGRSPPFRFQVADPPIIVKDPEDVFAEPGESVALKVEAIGATPMSYAWRKDGTPIPGATNPYLIIHNVQKADEAGYDCRVTNRLSPVTGTISKIANLRLARAPEIIAQPALKTIVDPGNPVSISAKFMGAPPMTYQWVRIDGVVVYENTTSLAGYTSVLMLENATETDDGFYNLVVANRLGNATSALGEISVNNPPVITSDLERYTVNPGESVTFQCHIEAEPMVDSVTWKFRPDLGGGEIIVQGETNLKLTLTNVGQEDEGQYVCLATNSAGSGSKTVGKLEVRDPPKIVRMEPVNQGGKLYLDPSQSVTLVVVATGLDPLSYVWQMNGVELNTCKDSPRCTFPAKEEGYVFVTVRNVLAEVSSIPIQLVLNEVAAVEEISVIPTNGRVVPGGFGAVECIARGTPPLTFRWIKDGDVISDEANNGTAGIRIFSDHNSSTLEIPDADYDLHDGNYSCSVSNSALPNGARSKDVTITVVQAPVIAAAFPEDKTHFPGGNLSFTCKLKQGTTPFAVRWYYTQTFNDDTPVYPLWNTTSLSNLTSKLDGAYLPSTTALPIELSLRGAAEEDQGLFSCEVCNEAGCATSRWANLGVHDSPIVIEQFPAKTEPNITVNPGEHVELSVTASGLEPLAFQWKRSDGEPIDLENNPNIYQVPENCREANQPCKLVFARVSPSNQGEYSCVVSNVLGMTSSVAVKLNVNSPPTLNGATNSWPANLITACPGTPFTHKLDILGTQPMTIQWYFSSTFEKASEIFLGEPLWSGEFHLKNPTFEDEGYYAFIATNTAGELRSTVARLEVNPGPSAAADATGVSPRHAITLPQTFTRLYGTASKGAATYRWTLINATVMDTSNVKILSRNGTSTDVVGLDKPGGYTFELMVADGNGCSSTDVVTVTVNEPPVPVVQQHVTVALPGDIVLDGSRSYDQSSDGFISKYEWKFISGNENHAAILESANGATTRLVNAKIGKYKVLFSVFDNDGARANKEVTVNVISLDILNPKFPIQAPFVVGSCYPHGIDILVQGELANEGNTTVDIRVQERSIIRSTVTALKLQSVQTNQYLLHYPWTVGHDLEPIESFIEVILDDQTSARSITPTFDIELPYQWFGGECYGYGSDDTCTWIRQKYDDSLCEKYAILPMVEDSSSDNDLWRIGRWSAGLHETKAEFCSRSPCGAKRTRSVTCISKDKRPLCQTAMKKPIEEEICGPGDRCVESEWNTRSCIPILGHSAHCYDSRTGFPLSSECTVGRPSAGLCEYVWKIDGQEGCETRNVTCVSKSNLEEIVSDDQCMAYTMKPTTTCINQRDKTRDVYWHVDAWSPAKCPSTCEEKENLLRERSVVCSSEDGQVLPDEACATILKKPAQVERCKDPCLSCPNQCGNHGTCQEGNVCLCDEGWAGKDCGMFKSSFPACGNILDINGACCDKIVDRSQTCCVSSVLDKNGDCCASGQVDVCGTCDGTAKSVDILGNCCSGTLDAAGKCCSSNQIDRCGVCDGDGKSCYLELGIDGRLNISFAESDNEKQRLHLAEVALMKSIGVRFKDATLRNLFRMNLLSNNDGGDDVNRRRQLVVSESGQGFTATFGVNPTTYEDLLINQAWNESTLLSVDRFDVSSMGICGNGICEHRERCLVGQSDSCCPFDCPLAQQVDPCPNGCSGHGKCLLASGQCECHPGYAGASCEQCAGDARQVDNLCIMNAWIPALAAAAPTQAPEEVTTIIWWPGILLGLFLMLFILLGAVMWKRRKEEEYRKASASKAVLYEVAHDQHGEDEDDDNDVVWKQYKTRGWVWKKSRTGFNGHQIWQQWYVILQHHRLHYFSSDQILHGKKVEEKGSIDLHDVDMCYIYSEKSKKYNGYRFDLVLRSKQAEEEVADVLDFPQVKRRESSSTAETRIQWMCDSKYDVDRLTTEIAKHTQSGKDILVPKQSFAKDKRISIELVSEANDASTIASEETSSINTATNEVMEGKDLVVGSFSGAVGSRVLYEGWVRFMGQNRNLYAVLFADMDEFVLYETMSPARDGAHHYVGSILKIPLAKVSQVVQPHGTNKFKIHYWDGNKPKHAEFLASSRTKPEWKKAFQQHMHFRHGIDVIAVGAEEEQEAVSPTIVIGDENVAVNEALSSLKLRKSGKVAKNKKIHNLAISSNNSVSSRRSSLGSTGTRSNNDNTLFENVRPRRSSLSSLMNMSFRQENADDDDDNASFDIAVV